MQKNGGANSNSGKIAGSDIENQALGVGFCRQIVILTTLALAWHVYLRRRRLAKNKRLAHIQINARKRVARYLIARSRQARSLLEHVVFYGEKVVQQFQELYGASLKAAYGGKILLKIHLKIVTGERTSEWGKDHSSFFVKRYTPICTGKALK